jgi:hypothetical protein
MMTDDVLRLVATLPEMSMRELEAEWRSLMGTEPTSMGRGRMVGTLAYRIQELAHGGLSQVARDRLQEALQEEDVVVDAQGRILPPRRRRGASDAPVAGTRLVRHWRGRSYEVTVLRSGFEFEGRRYRSLSAVARAITGTQWNGPAFFGLRKAAAAAGRQG